jgi:DNA-binding NtrC family response regulator
MRKHESKVRRAAGSSADDLTLLRREETLRILIVSPREDDYALLRRAFGYVGWRSHSVATCRDALAFLRWNRVAVLICDSELPDGNWKEILHGISDLACAPGLIVASRAADAGLWAEVLNLGGCDLLVKPLDIVDASWAIQATWRHWKERQVSQDRASGAGATGVD